MGASLATRVVSVIGREAMLDFLDEHYRVWTKVIGDDNAQSNLDGKGRECAVGTEYYGNLWGWERGYVHSLVRWVGIQNKKWHDKGNAKHCKPEIDRVFPILRGELERLDGLWKDR